MTEFTCSLVISVTVTSVTEDHKNEEMWSYLKEQSKRVEFWYKSKGGEKILTRTYFPLHKEVG